MPRGKPKVPVHMRIDRDIHRWGENVRRLRGWNRTQLHELALRELRKHGLPQTLNDDEESDAPQ